MELLLEYREYLFLLGLNFLISGVYIYMPTQAMVYVWGRMLGVSEKGKDLVKINRSRNIVALISTVLFSIGYILMKKEFPNTYEYVWEFFHWFSMGILLYVLLGFRLYSRIDTLLDKKLAKDKKEK